METPKFNQLKISGQIQKTKSNLLLFIINVFVFLFLAFGTSSNLIGSDLLKLADSNSVITLSGGKIALLSPPPVMVRGTINLPGAHIGVPLVLTKNPAAIAGGWVVIPTTGGNIAVISSTGVVIGTYNLPGDHIGRIQEFGAAGDFAVQTTGGLFSFFSANGTFLGTIDLPGEHATGPYNNPKWNPADSTWVVGNQNGEIIVVKKDSATNAPVQVGKTINYPGSPAAYGFGWYINQNLQIFENGKEVANLPGAFAFMGAGLLVNQNNQVFNRANLNAPPLNLPGAPAARPLAVMNGKVVMINQNFQIVNINPAGGAGGGPKQNGQALNLPGAPFVPVNKNGEKMLDSLIIAAGNNQEKLLVVNQNGQVWVVNQNDTVNGPQIVGQPINLPNSPLYVVRNGIPGVYVIAATGGHVYIVDARGPGGPVVLASFNYAGEHTGPPVMDEDVAGNHYAKISTASGVYIIDKSDFTFDWLNEDDMGGQLVGCFGPVMPGGAFSGEDVPISCDLSMAGEQEVEMVEFNVMDSNTGELVFSDVSFEPPFEIVFPVPEYALPGDAFTVTTEVFDLEGSPAGHGAGILSVISSLRVEALENLEALPGEVVFPTFEITNLGFNLIDVRAEILNEMGWPCEPPFIDIDLAPEETSVLVFETMVPEFEMPGTNRFTLEAFNLFNPAQSNSDYLDVTVTGFQQTITLLKGWGGISSYLQPENPELEIVFADVMEELVILTGMEGVFWPGENVNTIGAWNFEEGYKIKVEDDISLTIKGAYVSDGSLILEPGWHIIPVLSPGNVSSESILGVPGVVIAKEIAGNKVYWPGLSIFTLTTLETGKSYVVYVNSTVTLTYPAKASATGPVNPTSVVNLPASWNIVEPTPNTHVVAIPENVWGTLEKGDVIAAFNAQGINSGHAVYTGENMAIAVFGDDQSTTEIDGMIEGEEITFRVYRQSTGEVFDLDVVFDPEMPNPGKVFSINGLSGMVLKTGVGELAGEVSVNVYPNPASHYLNIDLSGHDGASFNLEVINPIGMNVYSTILGSGSSTRLDVSGWTEGFYFIRITNEQNTVTRKIIIRK